MIQFWVKDKLEQSNNGNDDSYHDKHVNYEDHEDGDTDYDEKDNDDGGMTGVEDKESEQDQ